MTRISVGLGLFSASVLAFAMIYTGSHSGALKVISFSTYGYAVDSSQLASSPDAQGLSTGLLTAVWNVWARAQGFEPKSHVEEFGNFYLRFVWLICPLVGFAVFWMDSRREIGPRFWLALAIGVVSALSPLGLPLTRVFLTLGVVAAETLRCLSVLFLMIWSSGAIRLVGRSPDLAKQPRLQSSIEDGQAGT